MLLHPLEQKMSPVMEKTVVAVLILLALAEQGPPRRSLRAPMRPCSNRSALLQAPPLGGISSPKLSPSVSYH